MSKAPNLQLLLGRCSNMAAHCSGCVFMVCVCVFTTVFVHLDGLNAEHKFRVWVTILGHTSLHFTYKYRLLSEFQYVLICLRIGLLFHLGTGIKKKKKRKILRYSFSYIVHALILGGAIQPNIYVDRCIYYIAPPSGGQTCVCVAVQVLPSFRIRIRMSFIARYVYTYEKFVFLTEASAVQQNDSDRKKTQITKE